MDNLILSSIIKFNAKKQAKFKNIPKEGLSLLAAGIASNSKNLVTIITETPTLAQDLAREITHFAPGIQVYTLPDWETLPYDTQSPHQDIISARLTTLNILPTLNHGIMLSPISTLLHRLPPKEYITKHCLNYKVKDKLNLTIINKELINNGYTKVARVSEHGQFATRGSILDLFPMGLDYPIRIELFDNEIETIRSFDKDSQRSIDKLTEINFFPAKEFPFTKQGIKTFRNNWRETFAGNPLNCEIYNEISEHICSNGVEYYIPLFFQHMHTILDYLPKDSTLIFVGDINKYAQEFWQEIKTRYTQFNYDVEKPILEPDKLFLPVQEFFALTEQFKQIRLGLANTLVDSETDNPFTLAALPDIAARVKTNSLIKLKEFLANHQDYTVLFCAETAGRVAPLSEILNKNNIYPEKFNDFKEFITNDKKTKFGLISAPINNSVKLDSAKLIIIAESAIYSHKVLQRSLRQKTSAAPDLAVKHLSELRVGALIVHLEHGIGKYAGLETLNFGAHTNEYLILIYANNDKVYVPVHDLHMLSRYSGIDNDKAVISKLGNNKWSKTKGKAMQKIADVAADLLKLYAARKANLGFSFNHSVKEFTSFCDEFSFAETEDQLKAIDDIINDMRSEHAMDRLICGDVGFGKTEVAMRAAFLAVNHGKQVAILVPTTLLAQQHYINLQDRFSNWPVNIGLLSRFATNKDNHATIEQLATGKLDIVVGTHKLLQKNIQFSNLGLLIIDEEHRFGVKQKEKIKQLANNVDVLTLTATPIPRTLNMALSGINDLSIIATPPAKRLAIKTFVYEHKDSIIHEAISRELMRGGQVYFLHNNIDTIENVAEKLYSLIPSAKIAVAHGQMQERQLEKIMSDFYHHRTNILVTTTIIETGIDIPSANTIIINDANNFGLAQLHQLRGRVGRSHHQAYAYLLVRNKKALSNDAKLRLDAISSMEELGSGFSIASQDLEIRGAGEILGAEQSGEIQSIGFSLYMDILDKTVSALKNGEILADVLTNELDSKFNLPAFIPDLYLNDVHLRLTFYKRISDSKTTAELSELRQEMLDRFGTIPSELENLFAISNIKLTAKKLGLNQLEFNKNQIKLSLSEKHKLNNDKIITLLQTKPAEIKLIKPSTLLYNLPEQSIKASLQNLHNLLHNLSL